MTHEGTEKKPQELVSGKLVSGERFELGTLKI
jgi:hypothetical protein